MLVRKLFSLACDERALPLAGCRSESPWREGDRVGESDRGWNAVVANPIVWYILDQLVVAARNHFGT